MTLATIAKGLVRAAVWFAPAAALLIAILWVGAKVGC